MTPVGGGYLTSEGEGVPDTWDEDQIKVVPELKLGGKPDTSGYLTVCLCNQSTAWHQSELH